MLKGLTWRAATWLNSKEQEASELIAQSRYFFLIQELSGAAHGKAAELKEKAAETHEQARQVASDTAGVRST